MTYEEMTQDLEAKYPELMNNVYLEVAEGWHKLLDEMCRALYALGPGEVKLTQVKEKFQLLRVYWSAPEELHNKVNDIVHNAEVKSATTCFMCGQPGFMISKAYYGPPPMCNICRDKK